MFLHIDLLMNNPNKYKNCPFSSSDTCPCLHPLEHPHHSNLPTLNLLSCHYSLSAICLSSFSLEASTLVISTTQCKEFSPQWVKFLFSLKAARYFLADCLLLITSRFLLMHQQKQCFRVYCYHYVYQIVSQPLFKRKIFFIQHRYSFLITPSYGYDTILANKFGTFSRGSILNCSCNYQNVREETGLHHGLASVYNSAISHSLRQSSCSNKL